MLKIKFSFSLILNKFAFKQKIMYIEKIIKEKKLNKIYIQLNKKLKIKINKKYK